MELKLALHAEDRRAERTPQMPADAIPQLQSFAKSMDVPPGYYYITLRDQYTTVIGYAAFKTVPDASHPEQSKLVLATILGPKMKPKGISLDMASGKPAVWQQAGGNSALAHFGIIGVA